MKLVITMSRRAGTGASAIAKELSERLNIPVYDKAYFGETLGKCDYKSETAAICKLAEKPCIILGRCASDILKDRLNAFNIYITAPREFRIKRIMELDSLTHDEAEQVLEETDQERATYYHEHTGKAWGDVNDYHMIIDTSEIGIENCANVLMQYFERKEYI
ncbi:MAG: cytidylate kinase-like family protein [Schaedlerella sp.]|nr:cytidylate kinase-like family protein [Schaedlerella sp.]